jgi:large subunit ribosomal protein L25
MEITLRCKASEIPPHIDLDIVDLHLGDSVHAGELDLGAAELATPPDALAVAVAKPRGVEELDVTEEDEEEFVFEEGEEPAGEEKPEEPAKE